MTTAKRYKWPFVIVLALAAIVCFFFFRMYHDDIKALKGFMASYHSFNEAISSFAGRGGADALSRAGEAVMELQAKASQALAALSGQRLGGLSVDDRGNLLALVGGRPQPALGLPPADRDACFLALRLALLERSLEGARLMALCDDAFAGLPEGARRLAARLLKVAAKPGQLLHFTRDTLFREAADHAT